MGRTSLTISDEAKDRFDEFKRDGESVEAAFLRLLDAAEGEFRGSEIDVPDGVLTEAHIDDIAERAGQRAADAVESRLR